MEEGEEEDEVKRDPSLQINAVARPMRAGKYKQNVVSSTETNLSICPELYY